MITVALCLPSKGRAEQLAENTFELMRQRQAVQPENVKLMIIVAAMFDDYQTIRAVDQLTELNSRETNVHLTLRNSKEKTAVQGWNKAYRIGKSCDAHWFVEGADDITWMDGWLEEALKVAEDTGAEVIGLNDSHTNIEDYAPHYMASRYFTEVFLGNCLVPAIYKSWWFDREVCQKARHHGIYAPAFEALALHNHPDWNTAMMDDTYIEAWPDHDEDRRIYELRKQHNFPLTQEAIIT